MSDASRESINVVLLDADEQFRTLMAHHITTAWPGAEIESLASLGDMDESAKPHCFVLDHMTLQQAANSEDAQIWFRAAAAIASSPCIVIADPSDELLAVRYIKGGARDFLPKRLIKHDLIISSINECLESAAESPTVQPADDEAAPNAADTKRTAKAKGQKNGKSRGRTRPKGNGRNGSSVEPESRPQDVVAPELELAEPAAPEFEPVHRAAPEFEPLERVAPEPEPVRQHESASAQQPERKPVPANGVARALDPSGPVIDGYHIISPIAKGGVASVCLAYSEKHGHDVALKVLRVSKSTAANKLYERFEQEYRLVSTIDSRSVVRTYDFGRTKKQVYIALEYFPGGDLRTRMRDPVSAEEAVDYLQKIATALDELHRLKILHRDLKPANVMLREDDSIALIDFGMAKQLQSTERLTLPGTVHGTPHYLSPEQAKGKVVDERSDIYSLGIMFFEMLEGRKPYTSKNALDVCMSHISDPVPKLSPDNAGYQLILDWMMSKDIDERCPNVGELLGVLHSKGVNPGT